MCVRIVTSITPHYSDVIMAAMASQMSSLTIVYSTVYSGADQRKNGHNQLCHNAALLSQVALIYFKKHKKYTSIMYRFSTLAIGTPPHGRHWLVYPAYPIWWLLLYHLRTSSHATDL